MRSCLDPRSLRVIIFFPLTIFTSAIRTSFGCSETSALSFSGQQKIRLIRSRLVSDNGLNGFLLPSLFLHRGEECGSFLVSPAYPLSPPLFSSIASIARRLISARAGLPVSVMGRQGRKTMCFGISWRVSFARQRSRRRASCVGGAWHTRVRASPSTASGTPVRKKGQGRELCRRASSSST